MNVAFILEHARRGDLAQWMNGPYDQVFNADVPAGTTVPLEIMVRAHICFYYFQSSDTVTR
jgi:hypothetical protein